jgi:RIO kinase 1
VVTDPKKHKISVIPKNPYLEVKIGDIGVGRVEFIKKLIASVDIYRINQDLIPLPIGAILHIREASQRFVKNMYEVTRPGDWLKFRVIRTNKPVYISLVGDKLGVIVSNCIRCGYELKYKRRNTLECPNCELIQPRITSRQFGNPLNYKLELVDRKKDRGRKRKKRVEDFQTVDAVIDLNAAKLLDQLQNKGFLGPITGTIASGKESGVFLAELGPVGEELCKELLIKAPIVIKIFRTSTLNFKRIINYISGDVRFRKRRRKTRHIINLWVEKEYRNLHRSSQAKINVPKPILVKNNILLMELLGKNGIPYPLLKNTPESFNKSTLVQILEQTKLLFKKAGLVHADLSPYNVLIGNQTPYFIDMSQSILVSHPKAFEFLKRDLRNIINSFSMKGLDVPNIDDLFNEIIQDFPDKNLNV